MNPNQYDSLLHSNDWLAERNQPVAIVLIELLEPAAGPDSIIFPPTYAFREEDKNQAKAENWLPYSISILRKDSDAYEKGNQIEGNICDLDTAGSQANRMEAIFAGPLKSLIPKITIKAKGSEVNLVEVGHRLADGLVRASDLFDNANRAFAALADKQNALPLAKLAPTSLVFGFWNSREKENTKLAIKQPRILSSIIRATNVAPIRRSAQFNEAISPRDLGLPSDLLDNLADMGLDSVPAPLTHGGVRVFGEITRKTEINLVTLRTLAVTDDNGINQTETLKLRRYLLGLCLIAARAQGSYNLRQGCLLIAKPDSSPSSTLVFPNGKRESFPWELEACCQFAEDAARAFEPGEGGTYTFLEGRVKEARQAKERENAEKNSKREAKRKSSG